jgi:hypothetical protein
MFSKFIKEFPTELRRVFKTEDSRFIVLVGLKVSGISMAVTSIVYWFLFEVMKLNYVFFRAHGFPDLQDSSSFFDMIIQEAMENAPILFGIHIGLFFVGAYVGWLILRPFKKMGDYCEEVIQNPNTAYIVDEFSTYNLFTRFSEFFFEYVRESRRKNEIVSNSIPPQYSKIHKPVMDKIFMLHFGLLLILISVTTALFINENTATVYESMIELATKTLKDQKSVSRFFTQQMFILDDIMGLTIALISVFYIFLGLHLYSKVSGAAFGIFSTMRSFMKGNHSSRVHLVGYTHLREYTRKLNKYLDYIQNNFSKDRTKN